LTPKFGSDILETISSTASATQSQGNTSFSTV
jgi:hypothetical protein